MRTAWLLVVVTVAAAACHATPRYAPPSIAMPAAFKEDSAGESQQAWKAAHPRDTARRGAWWTIFDDVRLNALEARLDSANQSVAAAAANVQVARAAVRVTRSQLFPTVTSNPGIVGSHVPTGFGHEIGTTFMNYSVPFDVAWEPDLWSRVRMSMQSGSDAAQAALADFENVRLAAHADLAIDYYSLRAQDILAQVLDSSVAAQRQTLALTRALFTAGRSNGEAVAQAEAQLDATQAQATGLGVARAQYEHAIAVLVGEAPSSFSIPSDARWPRPPSVPLGVPSELLERRPDIAAAERSVAQANVEVGIARTAFFPSLTLDASAGVLSTTVANLLTWPSRVWSVGPTLLHKVVDGGARRANVDESHARYDQSVADYRRTVLAAIAEVEDNLAAVRILGETLEQQNAAVDAARRALREADVRYRAGLDPYLNVLVAQAALLAHEQTAVNLTMQRMIASVQLVKALGGTWADR